MAQVVLQEEIPFLDRYSRYVPPKGQLLKWVGNKQKFAAEIIKHFPKNYRKYYEPFLGSGAIMATLSPMAALGSDTFKPLMEIWETLIRNPQRLIDWYADRWNLIGPIPKAEVYAQVLSSYNRNPNGADFLFLTRTCYGGIIRFRKLDGYMSTPCGVHYPISVKSFADRVFEWKNRLKNVDFIHCDYKEAFEQAKAGDLIYCDPPYSHSQSILYGAQDFSLIELLNEIEKAKTKGVKVALSIDGHKKSGTLLCELPVISELFKNEVYINCGRSMLRRFQLEGQTLENENVSDRLFLT